eukprot:403333475
MSRFLQNTYFSPSPTQSTPGAGDQSSGPGSCSLFSRPFSLFHDNQVLTPSQPNFNMMSCQNPQQLNNANFAQEDSHSQTQKEVTNPSNANQRQQYNQQTKPADSDSIMISLFGKNKSSINKRASTGKYQRKYPLPSHLANDTNHTLDKPQRHFEDSVDNIAGTPFIPKMPAYKRKRGGLMDLMASGYSFNCIDDSKPQLDTLIQLLDQQSIIYLDYFEHTYRSYYGFICWLIIKVPLLANEINIDNSACNTEQVFMIDCIKLRTQIIELISITANPKIMKVVPISNQEGALFDPTHLQRDFGLYMINVFQGLQSIVNDNSQQDYRIRPVEDIYKYSKAVALELVNGIGSDEQLFQQNQKISGLQYHKKQMTQNLNGLDNNSLNYQLLKWRDDISRLEDESLEYTLPTSLLNSLVQNQQSIFKVEDIVELSHKTLKNYLPLLVEQNLDLILQITLHFKATNNFLDDIKSPQQPQIEETLNQSEKQIDSKTDTQPVRTVSRITINQTPQKTQQDPANSMLSPSMQQKFNQSATSNKSSNYEPNLFRALNWSTTKPIPTQHVIDLATPERQYHKILTQKHFTPSFFADSVDNTKKTQKLLQSNTKRGQNTSDGKNHLQMSEGANSNGDSTSSFKLNREPCLNIFNRIKCFNDQERLASPEQRKYFSSLEMINERDENTNVSNTTKGSLRIKHSSTSIAMSSKTMKDQQEEYDRIALEEGAPETLRDIFKISNRNRKRNKQKKKNKGGVDISSEGYSDSNSNTNNGNSGRNDRENAFSIIANQYKQDITEGRSNHRDVKGTVNDIKQLDDLEFMKMIGMINEEKLQELAQKQEYNSYSMPYGGYSTGSGFQSQYYQSNNSYGSNSTASSSYTQNSNAPSTYQRKAFQPQSSNFQNQQNTQQQSYIAVNQNYQQKPVSVQGNYQQNSSQQTWQNNQNVMPFKKSPLSFQKSHSTVAYGNNSSYNQNTTQHGYSRQLSYGNNSQQNNNSNNGYKSNNANVIYSPKDFIKKR